MAVPSDSEDVTGRTLCASLHSTFPLLLGEQEMLDTSTQSPQKVSAKMKSMLWLLPCVLGSCDV